MSVVGNGYEFFEHTADIGLRASGATLPELFTHAAQGFVELVAEHSVLKPTATRTVHLEAPSVEALLQAWLTELLVWFDAERFLPCDYAFDLLTPTQLRANVHGARFDPTRHTCGTEVKGITRHQFRVEHASGRWQAEIIFDV